MNPWARFTQARLALGQAGASLPTRVHLELQKAQALARDALWKTWDHEQLREALKALSYPSFLSRTPVSDRQTYLARPDLGRTLEAGELARLRSPSFLAELRAQADPSLVFCVTDGLSAEAVEKHMPGLLHELLPRLSQEPFYGKQPYPFFIIPFARVAVADVVAAQLSATMSVIFVGERPGLSAQDSLGIYLTHSPRPGTPDSCRNCISNIRPGPGLSYADASEQLCYLLRESRRRGISGIELKGMDQRPKSLPFTQALDKTSN